MAILMAINVLKFVFKSNANKSKLFKREPSLHQKQMRFMSILLCVLAISIFIGLLLLVNLNSSMGQLGRQ
jgi:hypothetical protein